MPLRRSAVRIALVVVAALFGLVLEQVVSGGPLADADRTALGWIIHHRVSFVTDVCRGVTLLGDGRVVGPIVAAAVLLLAGRRWRLGALVAATAIVTSLLTTLTKSVVGRPRPPVHVRLVSVSGPAFPSGHASIAVACYLTLAAVLWASSPPGWRRVAAGAAAILVTLAIGWSRIYLGAHWPSDVLGGWLLGAGVLLALVGGGARWAGTRP